MNRKQKCTYHVLSLSCYYTTGPPLNIEYSTRTNKLYWQKVTRGMIARYCCRLSLTSSYASPSFISNLRTQVFLPHAISICMPCTLYMWAGFLFQLIKLSHGQPKAISVRNGCCRAVFPPCRSLLLTFGYARKAFGHFLLVGRDHGRTWKLHVHVD